MQNFSGEGAHPLPRGTPPPQIPPPVPRSLPQWGGGHSLPTPHPLGASILTPPHSEILPTLLANDDDDDAIYDVQS